ncbi:hypothetical protein HUK80_04165 [Flavobacterium sp. MAH-1]|uniref:Tox-MPTase4 domain-containing protein n=1 Tax=Flavobacterium agri TaxID=2743471 RepID=A0A7Y8Y024_9FLAO|nr:zincin-like metallopeptidase toxin domain-containing protein [Flavobacterium agri]NUY80079.1 hypothetical protein [Flavobacterium agri]NYA70104.1 hypothetical protein [Flavobacterium agri]
MTFINQNNGFDWQSSNDGALFENLFPDDSSADLLEPSHEGSPGVAALSPNEPDVDPDPGKIVIYVGRYDYNDMVSASKGYLKSRFDVDPMGCQLHYISGRKDALFVCLGSKLFYYLKDKTSAGLNETIRIIHAFCRKNDKTFAFTADEIFKAFQKEIQDGTFILANVPQERRQTYALHVNQLYNNLEKPNDPKSLELVAKILDLTQQMSIEASATVSAIAEEASNPWRNNYLYADNSPFSLDDLQRLYKQLKASDNATEKFKNGDFKTAEELVDHVNRFFAAKNSSMRFLIHYPFLKLSKKQREKLILLFVDADERITSRASINSDLSDGDIVLVLFYYCNQAERLAIIKSLEADEKLYQLLSLSYFDCFNQLAYLIGNTFMESIADKESLVNTYIEEGHGLYLNTNLFGTHNKEGFDDENKKITFEIKTNRLLSLLDETSPIRALIEEGTDTFPTSLTPERQYKPLDLVVIVPVADFTFAEKDFVAGETYLMPACMAYCLFKDDTKNSWLTTLNIAFQIALCFTGVGGIVSAVRAGSVAAAVLGVTDIVVGVGGVVVNSVPEIERKHPEFVKYYNYFTYIYTVLRLSASAKKAYDSRKKELASEADLTPEDMDWMNRKTTVGNLGGKLLSVQQLRRLRKILSEHGVELIVEGAKTKKFKDMWFYMRSKGYPGGFNAVTKQFFLRSDATEIVAFHELAHFNHWKMAKERYSDLTDLAKETYVWEQILKNRHLWTKEELIDSLNYINSFMLSNNKKLITVKGL